MRSRYQGIVVFILGATLAQCGGGRFSAVVGSFEGDNNELSKLTTGCFLAANNPDLKSGSLIGGFRWKDPNVLKINDEYVMYVSSDQNSDKLERIFRLVSNDGSHWSLNPSHPVLEPDSSEYSVSSPTVVVFNNLYHLFFTDSQAESAVFHAVSQDGINWSKDSRVRLSSVDIQAVAQPGAVVFQNQIYLYFAAQILHQAPGTTVQVIGLARSSDGTQWSTPQVVLAPDQALYPRAQSVGFGSPQPIVMTSGMHLFFDVKDSESRSIVIQHAHSVDGMSQWRVASSAILSRANFSWASQELGAPAPLLDGNILHLWFAGHNDSIYGVGHAQCGL